MTAKFTLAILAGLAGIVLGAVVHAQEVRQDVASLAGQYFEGDGLGVNWSLTLTSKGSFSFTWHGCLGLYDESEGNFAVEGGALVLRPAKPTKTSRLPTRWLPIVWGERMYLLEENQIPLFTQYVNFGWEPRTQQYGLFMIRQTDWEKNATGSPRLPAQWAGFILDRPVDSLVTRLLPGRRAEIGAGINARLRPGMLLTAVQGNDWFDVKVVSVEQDRSTVEAKKGHVLTVGQRVTSKL